MTASTSPPTFESTVKRGPDFALVSTYDEIAASAQAVRALLDELNIRLHRDSALGKMLRDAERVARDFREGNPLHEPGEPLRIGHANRVSSAILDVGRDAGARECLRRMTGGGLELAARGPAQEKDALWEIELAAWLRRHGLPVDFAEPDLVIDIANERYPIACKKVHSERGVEAQMRKGVKQLAAFGAPGLVAFDVGDLTLANSIIVRPDSRTAGDHLADLNREFIVRNERRLERYIADGRCHGVLVTTSVVADLEASAQRLNNFSQTTVWTLPAPRQPTAPAFHAVVAQLQRVIPSP